jgi:hypothetical protein
MRPDFLPISVRLTNKRAIKEENTKIYKVHNMYVLMGSGKADYSRIIFFLLPNMNLVIFVYFRQILLAHVCH